MLIPERVWAQMTDDEKRVVNEAVEGWRNTRTLTCPKCSATLEMKFKIEVAPRLTETELTPPQSKPAPVEKRDPSTIAAEERFIASAKESGLLSAFEEAVSTLNPQSQPSDTGRFLVNFFKLYGIKTVPRPVLERYQREFEGRVEFWSALGVVAVVVDRVVRQFVPLNLIVGAPVRDFRGKERGRLGTDQDAFETWVRGRHGYVPAGSMFADALNLRNRGKFDNLGDPS